MTMMTNYASILLQLGLSSLYGFIEEIILFIKTFHLFCYDFL